jgi:hypothetical protein
VRFSEGVPPRGEHTARDSRCFGEWLWEHESLYKLLGLAVALRGVELNNHLGK